MSDPVETATFAGGCFWCTEAVFLRLKGVRSAVPGYAGGHVANPTYEQVCRGRTGHAEAVQIAFDPQIIAYETLLDVFWHTHDPTTLDQQGIDEGPQYRSVIFFHSEQQQATAERSKRELELSHLYPDPIVTEIGPFTNFYEAEDYHKNFYDTYPDYGYCEAVIAPKLQKLLALYGDTAVREGGVLKS